MSAPSKLAVEIAEAISPKALDNSPTDAGDRAAIARIIDRHLAPLLADKERLDWLDIRGNFEALHSFFVERYRPFKAFPCRQVISLLRYDAARAQRPAQEGSDKT